MFSKLLIPTLIYFFAFSFGLSVAGQDTIPPTITFDSSWFDEMNNNPHNDKRYYLSNDTLEIRLSCSYSFPQDYYFQLENAIIEDNSGVFSDTIILDDIIYDDYGYGTVFQTIIAEDIAGNSSKFVIKSTIGGIPNYVLIGFDVGGIPDNYDEVANTLKYTDFEFCKDEIIEIAALYLSNECTGYTKIDWYINDELVSSDTNRISIDLSKQKDHIKVEAEANFSNTNLSDRIGIDIQKTVTFTEIKNPTCSNSADGSIKLDPGIIQFAEWGHSNSNATYLDSLVAGTYYVTYYSDNQFNVCKFHDTITLVPENILDFTVSDTIIDLNQKDFITINNISTTAGDYFWQIGDSSFINNSIKFDYYFKSSGNYEIKLTDNSSICNDVIYKNILVEGNIPVLDTIPPTITIYVNRKGGDFFDNYISSGKGKDTLEIRFSCLYSFPGEYGLYNVNIEDDSEVLISNIGVNKVIRDTINGFETGYGSVIQTIYAEDIYGNISELIIKFTIGDIYSFDFDAMKVGDIEVFYDYSTNSLSQTDFEFCETQDLEVEVLYNKNGCTGNSKIDWYKNDVLALKTMKKFLFI